MDNTNRDIDAILEDYEKVKKHESDLNKKKLLGEKQTEENVLQVFKKIIVPKLNFLKGKIDKKGHACNIIENLESMHFQSVEFNFKPLSKVFGHPIDRFPSHLLLIFSKPNLIQIKKFIKNREGATTHDYEDEVINISFEAIDGASIEKQVVNFIEMVLKEN